MNIKRSIIWKIPKNKFKSIVKKSSSYTDVLRKLGVINKGGNINTLKRRIKFDDIDTNHIKKGITSNKGRNFGPRKPLDFYLVKGDKNGVHNCVKRRLIKDGLLINKCQICKMKPIWRKKKLVLILDHINGISYDNRLKNLRLVCPNCNSQLPTHCGKNMKYGLV